MIYDLHWTHPGLRNGEIHENHTTDDRNGIVLRSLVYRSLPGRLPKRQTSSKESNSQEGSAGQKESRAGQEGCSTEESSSSERPPRRSRKGNLCSSSSEDVRTCQEEVSIEKDLRR